MLLWSAAEAAPDDDAVTSVAEAVVVADGVVIDGDEVADVFVVADVLVVAGVPAAVDVLRDGVSDDEVAAAASGAKDNAAMSATGSHAHGRCPRRARPSPVARADLPLNLLESNENHLNQRTSSNVP